LFSASGTRTYKGHRRASLANRRVFLCLVSLRKIICLSPFALFNGNAAKSQIISLRGKPVNEFNIKILF